jgi:hypothetical protein
MWIIKDKAGSLEAKVMPDPILAALFVVPFETHGRLRRRSAAKDKEQ